MDIFDEIELKDVFDEVESDQIGDKIFDEVEKELPSLVRSYVKEQTKKIKTLTAKEISNLVDAAISAIPKEKPTEKIIEKRIEVVPAKDTKKWAELSKIDEINKRIDELKNSFKREPDVKIIGEMLPNHNGITGVLQSDGNKLLWGQATSTGSGDMAASVYDPTNKQSDAFDVDNHFSGTTNKVFSASDKNKLDGIQDGAEVNVNADWNAISGDAVILNKPTIPGSLNCTSTIINYSVSDSNDLVECLTALTVTLHSYATAYKKQYLIKNTGSLNVTVVATGGNISGESSQVLYPGDCMVVIPGTTQWEIV